MWESRLPLEQAPVILAAASIDSVVAVAAIDVILAAATLDRVAAIPTVDVIVAAATHEHVAAIPTVDRDALLDFRINSDLVVSISSVDHKPLGLLFRKMASLSVHSNIHAAVPTRLNGDRVVSVGPVDGNWTGRGDERWEGRGFLPLEPLRIIEVRSLNHVFILLVLKNSVN